MAKANCLAQVVNALFTLAYTYLLVTTMRDGRAEQEYKFPFVLASVLEGHLVIFHVLLAVWPAYSIYMFAKWLRIIPYLVIAPMLLFINYCMTCYFDDSENLHTYCSSVVVHMASPVLAGFTRVFHTWKAERPNPYAI